MQLFGLTEKDGILQNTDVLIKGGKIAKVGKNISDASARNSRRYRKTSESWCDR
jgi:dihydroorotase-like cyclic amidohydrolase